MRGGGAAAVGLTATLTGAVLLTVAPNAAALDRAFSWAAAPEWAGHADRATVLSVCVPDPEPPPYYKIDLVSTRRVPGTLYTTGVAESLFAESPFGVNVAPDGSYVHRLDIAVEQLPKPSAPASYVVWVTTPSLDRVERLGILDDSGRLTGQVQFNKFLVVVSMEPDSARDSSRWSGPIVVRGMSRSGAMHTMAGHGPFEQENCAKYGYD